MRKCLVPSFSSLLLLVATLSVAQEKKEFTYDQLFKGNPATLVQKQLPTIYKWIDDDHYIEARREGNDTKQMSVDVKTGNAVPYDGGTQITTIGGGTPSASSLGLTINDKNITASPDKKWVA